MERIVEQAYLYDFYGELLTKHQQMVYEDYVLNNLSLSEIAKEQGISRQGVHDLIRRCDNILQDYESKLCLFEKFLRTKKQIQVIHELVNKQEQYEQTELFNKIKQITGQILENL